jgi:hypothetical protein
MRALAGWRGTILEYQDVGVIMLLQSLDLEIRDVPVSMQLRRDGKSRIFYSWSSVLYYMFYTLLLGFSKRGQNRQGSLSEYD